jgi:monoamine oxidase
VTGTPLSPSPAFLDRPHERQGTPQDVLVIGAGLAGLAAAYELARSGHRVTVLEAQERAGGRVHTIRGPFADGLYAEAGAVFIPHTHVLTLAYARDVFDLPLVTIGPSTSRSLYYVHDTRITKPNDPSTVWPVQLRPDEKGGIETLWRKYIIPSLGKIGDPRANDWPGPALAEFDDVTFAAFLAAQGASPGALDLLRLGYFDLWGDGFDSYSALFLLRDLEIALAPPPHLALPTTLRHPGADASREGSKEKESTAAVTTAGGNWKIPDAFATSSALRDRIVYRAPVVRVEHGPEGVEVVCNTADGARRFRANRLIITVPFSVLGDVEFSPRLSQAKQRAVQQLPYTSATRVYVQAPRRFWDTRDLPGIGNTDLPVMWVHDATATQQATRGILESYTAGARAREVTSMDEETRFRRTRDGLKQVYAPVDDSELEPGTSWSWEADPWARGGYCWFKPGQMRALYRDIVRAEGTLHFAGDHASPLPGWMEGAFESAYRVVREVNEAEKR